MADATRGGRAASADSARAPTRAGPEAASDPENNGSGRQRPVPPPAGGHRPRDHWPGGTQIQVKGSRIRSSADPRPGWEDPASSRRKPAYNDVAGDLGLGGGEWRGSEHEGEGEGERDTGAGFSTVASRWRRWPPQHGRRGVEVAPDVAPRVAREGDAACIY